MIELAHSQLPAWQSFYVIVGSSAAALIGIQFVVIALIANLRMLTTAEAIRAFGTPTVVHLSCALVVSAVMSAPWMSLAPVSVALLICGACGLGYGSLVIQRTRRQTSYLPVMEDWLWHAIVPCSTYMALILAALFLRASPLALFVVAGASLGLLFIGIHNAWDSVTHVIVRALSGETVKAEAADPPRGSSSVPHPEGPSEAPARIE